MTVYWVNESAPDGGDGLTIETAFNDWHLALEAIDANYKAKLYEGTGDVPKWMYDADGTSKRSERYKSV